VKKPTEEGENRSRACTVDELKRLKAACYGWHDEAMWRAIQKAVHTMLRQKDLISVEPGEYIKLYQGKTGKPIIIPV
jgi:excinuclease UvrABC nuclease subunit